MLILTTAWAVAQEERPADSTQNTPWVSVSGNASLTADFYDYTSDPLAAQKGRRPTQLYRLVFNPTITFGGLFAIPFNIMLTLPETNVTTPIIQNPSLGEYILNPANAFGFSSIAPRIGWAQFYLGSHTPQYSPLSNSDLPLFGAGFDLQPLGMRLAASGGIVQRAVEPDSSGGSNATYRRDMYMGRVGTADNDEITVGVNVAYSKDDASSLQNNIVSIIPPRVIDGDSTTVLPADTIRLRPEEGFMATADVLFGIAKGVKFTAEGAISSFTRDATANVTRIDGNPIDFVMTTRTSTRVDYAGSAALIVNADVWGITLNALFLGAGYAPITQPYQQSDRLEFRVAPSLRLFEGNLTFNGTVGYRINNLSETKGETMSMMLLSGNINAQITEEFTTLLRYSNYGVRNSRDLDTLRIQNVSQSMGIEPALMIDGESAMHAVNASVSLDTYEDYNVVSGVESSNDIRSATLNYLGSLKSIPISIGINGSYLENVLFTGMFIVRSLGAMASYRFLNGDVVPSLSVTIGSSSLGAVATDAQMFFKAAVRWRITKTTNFNVSYGNNQYIYGNPASRGSSFSERLLQLALTTSF